MLEKAKVIPNRVKIKTLPSFHFQFPTKYVTAKKRGVGLAHLLQRPKAIQYLFMRLRRDYID